MVSQDPKLYLICSQSYIYYLNGKEGNESAHIYISWQLFTGSSNYCLFPFFPGKASRLLPVPWSCAVHGHTKQQIKHQRARKTTLWGQINKNDNNSRMNRTEANFSCSCQTELSWQGKECVFVISSCALAVEQGLGHGTLGQSQLFQICSACTVSCIFPLCFVWSQLTDV